MSEESPQKRARPSEATMAFLLEVGRQRNINAMRIDGTDAIGKSSAETGHVLLQFLDSYVEVANGFLERSGVRGEVLRERLSAEHTPEPPPGPRRLPENPTDEQMELHELIQKSEAEREARGDAAPFSGPVRAALKTVRDEAIGAGLERFSLASLIASVIETESFAQMTIASLAEPDRLVEAVQWLREQPDAPNQGPIFSADKIRTQMRETVDAAWPEIQRKGEASDRVRRVKDELYEKNPAAYEEPLDIAARLAEHLLPPEQDYLWRGGVLLHAAENEARIRRAPEATLDHLLFALLRGGTDAAEFLDGYGVDRAAWSRQMDIELPRYSDGPRWPRNGRDLGMSIPSNVNTNLKPLPEGKKIEEMEPAELRQYVERRYDLELRFTDLRFLINLHDEPKTIGHRLFSEAGITADDLKAEIAGREKGDRDWWRKPFDLAKAWQEAEPGILGLDSSKAFLCQQAAQHEARLRGAPEIEFDDLLFALLVPGTDLSALVASLGGDVAEWREEVDRLRPRFSTGPMFPKSDNFHLNPISSTLVRKGWSDLVFVRNALRDHEAKYSGLALLQSKGVTLDVIDARLAELDVELI